LFAIAPRWAFDQPTLGSKIMADDDLSGTVAKPDDKVVGKKKVKIKLKKVKKPVGDPKQKKTVDALGVDFVLEEGEKKGKPLIDPPPVIGPHSTDEKLFIEYTKKDNGETQWDVSPQKGDGQRGPWFHIKCPKEKEGEKYIGKVWVAGPSPDNEIEIDSDTQTKLIEQLKKLFPSQCKDAEKNPKKS
jgi:hypothetical protein